MDRILRLKRQEGSDKWTAYTRDRAGEEQTVGEYDSIEEAGEAYKESLEEGQTFIMYTDEPLQALTVNTDRSNAPAPDTTSVPARSRPAPAPTGEGNAPVV